MWGDTEMSEPGRGERRSHLRALLGSLDVALVAFGLATGVLAVGAGELVYAGGQPSGLSRTTSMLVTVTIAAVAVRIGDPLLRWLLARGGAAGRAGHR
jgi:hypothetical protein